MTSTAAAGATAPDQRIINGAGPSAGQGGSRERTFSWDDPVAIANAGAGLSGLEFLAAIRDGTIPKPPVMQTLDIDGISFAAGNVAFGLTPAEFHYNPIGVVHGGVLATLLDSACGCAVHTMLPRGVFYTSLDLTLKFLRPVTTATGPLTATGTVTHLGRRTALAEARLTDAAGKLYATATSSCLIMRQEQPPA
jgi:uncharacterized protein (TIGR00369 family)